MLRVALAAGLLLSACGGTTTATSTTTAPPPPPTAATTTLPPTTTSTPTTTTTLPPLPDLDGELTWFAPLPPLSIHPERPYIGSEDFMDLFPEGAEWQAAASHLEVFKLYGEWVAYTATDEELRTAVEGIRRRGMALAVEAGPLDAPPDCGQGIEGFAGTAEGRLIADRIIAAGGTIDLIALDEPYYFAAIYDGPDACRWTPEMVAAEVGEYIDLMRGYFPNLIVGDTEPAPDPVVTSTYTSWLETFRAVNGYDLAFLHLDIDWSRTEWPVMVREIVEFGRAFGVPIGMIYIGNSADPTDEAFISVTGERVLRLEDEYGVDPPHILFQSWLDKPDRVLPEGEPFTFTGLIRVYFEDRDLLGFRTEGAGANLALRKEARASRTEAGKPAALAFDGDTGTLWSAGAFPTQWIEVDLGDVHEIGEIRLVPSQFPAGRTVHRVLGSGPATGGFVELGVLDGETTDGDLLVLVGPWEGIDTIRVQTTVSPSWVAWREIEVIAAGP